MARLFSENIVHSSDRKLVDILPGVQRRTLVWGPSSMLAEWQLKAGAVIPPDRNPEMEAVAYVVSGRVEVNMGEKPVTLKGGSAFIASFRTEHSITALDDSIVMVMFSPPQEEWKQ